MHVCGHKSDKLSYFTGTKRTVCIHYKSQPLLKNMYTDDLVYQMPIPVIYLLGMSPPSAASTVSVYCVVIVSTSSTLLTVIEPVALLMSKLPAYIVERKNLMSSK